MKTALVILASLSAIAHADEKPPIATDRPGFSDGSNIVGDRVTQLEMGFFRTYVQGDATTSLGDFLIRHGLGDDAELRIIGVTYGFASNGKSLLDPSIGFKVRLQRPSGKRGEITFIGQSTVPIGSSPLRANAWNPTTKLAATTLLGIDTLGSNIVWSRLGSTGSQFNQLAATVFLSHPLNARVSLTPEFWMVDHVGLGQSSAAYGSLAATYLATNNTQFDLRIGSAFNQARDGWFIQGGYSVRF